MNWLFLRGLIQEQSFWGDFREVFQREHPHDRVFCLDLPGFGTEYSRRSQASIESIANDVRGRWLELRKANPGSWSALGHSLGGMAFLSWIGHHPKDFERAVMINASAGDLNRFYERYRPGIWLDGVHHGLRRDPVRQERIIMKMTSQHAVAYDKHLTLRSSCYVDRPLRLMDAFRQMWAGLHFKSPESLATSALFMTARNDRLVHHGCSEKLAKKYGAEFRIHPTAGHDLMLDDPHWIASEISAWMNVR
jgi:pimeloyl-ACP methyl ester carboxylesterase